MYLGEVSVNFDMVLNDDFVSCILEDFPNEMELVSDVVSIVLSVCFIFLCCCGGWGGSVWVFGIFDCMLHARNLKI